MHWLRERIDPDAKVSDDQQMSLILSSMALSEISIFGCSTKTLQVAEKCCEALIKTYSEDKVYQAKNEGQGDLRLLSWAFLAIRSAKSAELKAMDPPKVTLALKKFEKFLLSCLSLKTGMASFTPNGAKNPLATQMTMFGCQTLGYPRNHEFLTHASKRGVQWLEEDSKNLQDIRFIYFSRLASFQYQGNYNSKSRSWLKKVSEKKRKQMILAESTFLKWDSLSDPFSQKYGGVVQVAMLALTQEIYYIYDIR